VKFTGTISATCSAQSEGAGAFRPLKNVSREQSGLEARRKLAGCPILKALFAFRVGTTARILTPAIFFLVLLLAGCHSYHIDATIENRTGAPIQLLEVDYPSASFGANTIAPGADFHYRIDVTGDGPLKITYTRPDGKQAQTAGPKLFDRQQGRLEIVLLPDGKAEFHPQLTPAS
jgi:hypothetical protein